MTRLPHVPLLRMAFLAVLLPLSAPTARADIYPTNVCVGAKQRAAGAYCHATLAAWARWETKQNATARDAALQRAAGRLGVKWGRAETKSQAQGVGCTDTTLSSADAETQVDTAVGGIVTAVNGGLDLVGNSHDARCGRALLLAAGLDCGRLLMTENFFIRGLARDPHALKRDRRRMVASRAFNHMWSRTIARGCPTTATQTDVEGQVQAARDDVVTNTTVSPNVDDAQFTTITPTGPVQYQGRAFNPICKDGSPYAFFVKRGSVNKLLVYYQGGGACWENVTCSFNGGVCDANVNPAGGDNPNNQHNGFSNVTNPLNPFKDWNVVFVAYCSCDIHFGDAAQDYAGIFPTIHVEHRGYQNSRVVEKWTREHFVNPDRVFVTGSSAGAYGAWFNAPLHERIWPASHFDVLADAGNGVITQDFLDNEFPHWNFAANLPADLPQLQEVLTNGTGIPGYTQAVSDLFPDTRWAHYATAYDGGLGGQTGFYNVMLNPGNIGEWLNWWHSSCAFNAKMRQQAIDTAAAIPSNYRYYIGSGSRHTMWGSNKVYADTTGGVPTIVSWINGMLDGTPAWSNVECINCGLTLTGDPVPSPLAPPFAQVGPDILVQCPSSASGAFLDAQVGD